MSLFFQRFSSILLIGIFIFLITACSSSRPLSNSDFSASNTSAEEIIPEIPNYRETLTTISGKGRALVSEPGNSDRATITFQADSINSLLTIQNRIGMQGGKMLVDSDSILIYNQIDDIAQKMSVYDGRMTSLNELASVNILDLLNFKVRPTEDLQVLENNNFYQLRFSNGTRVYVTKTEHRIRQVEQTISGIAPYSKIEYENYGKLNGFILPRRITIFSSDKKSRVIFLIRDLTVNPELPELEISIPNEVEIQRL